MSDTSTKHVDVKTCSVSFDSELLSLIRTGGCLLRA